MRARSALWFILGAVGCLLFFGSIDDAASQPLLSGKVVATSLIGADPLEADGDDVYENETVGQWPDRFLTLLARNVYPALPGVLLLFLFSTFFSAINFYGVLQEGHRSFGKTYRYLFCWVSFNYVFALIFLLLILPDDVSMTSISKPLFVYCLVATSLPELFANVRLQLGQSSRVLDLYRYKQKLSDIIVKRMEIVSSEEQNHDLRLLQASYADRKQQFKTKLRTFILQLGNISDGERSDLLAKINDGNSEENPVADVLEGSPGLTSKILSFFREDVEQFRHSPTSRLMSKLIPTVSVHEANNLVSRGITNSRKFIWRMHLPLPHSTSKCNKRGSDFDRFFKAQALSGPVID